MNISSILVAWLVTAASFFVITKLPIGVDIDTPEQTFVSAAVLGIISALVRPVLSFLFRVPNALTFNIFPTFFTFAISAMCFGLAANFVQGFRLRFGAWSAILGAFSLSVVTGIIYQIIPF
jgi:putative membrane protein